MSYVYCVPRKTAKLCLSEVHQISTIFDEFWHIYIVSAVTAVDVLWTVAVWVCVFCAMWTIAKIMMEKNI